LLAECGEDELRCDGTIVADRTAIRIGSVIHWFTANEIDITVNQITLRVGAATTYEELQLILADGDAALAPRILLCEGERALNPAIFPTAVDLMKFALKTEILEEPATVGALGGFFRLNLWFFSQNTAFFSNEHWMPRNARVCHMLEKVRLWFGNNFQILFVSAFSKRSVSHFLDEEDAIPETILRVDAVSGRIPTTIREFRRDLVENWMVLIEVRVKEGDKTRTHGFRMLRAEETGDAFLQRMAKEIPECDGQLRLTVMDDEQNYRPLEIGDEKLVGEEIQEIANDRWNWRTRPIAIIQVKRR
jgi:hypothetical protein